MITTLMQDIRITFLGTSAGMPARDRNVASVALTVDGRVLLFDCGEGTQHQMMRSQVRPGAIEAIFLSHLHGDHLFGLPGVLASMSLNGRSSPLSLYGPAGVAAFVQSLPLFHTSFPVEIHEVLPAAQPVTIRRDDGYRVDAVSVDHSAPCFAFRFVEDDRPGAFDLPRAQALGVPAGPLFRRMQLGSDVTLDDGRVIRSSDVVGAPRQGRRVVYCTDTRPCAAAIDLARDADVLIHESTYGADTTAEAVDRKHATAAEAASVAREAGAGRLILTHISPRYTDPEVLRAQAAEVFSETEIASDLAVYEVR